MSMMTDRFLFYRKRYSQFLKKYWMVHAGYSQQLTNKLVRNFKKIVMLLASTLRQVHHCVGDKSQYVSFCTVLTHSPYLVF